MENEPKNGQNVSMWITSLAISVTCCAVLFVIFANYFVAINKNLADANARLASMELSESKLLSEMESMHHTMMTNAPATTQTASPAPAAPTTTPPGSATPAPTTPAAASAPSAPTAPAEVVTPPAATKK